MNWHANLEGFLLKPTLDKELQAAKDTWEKEQSSQWKKISIDNSKPNK